MRHDVILSDLPADLPADTLVDPQVAEAMVAQRRRAARPPALAAPDAPTVSGRTTVLPRIEISDDIIALFSKNQLRYETIGQLGVGGVGEVMLARDNDIGRDVAVKRIKGAEQDGVMLARFLDEIQTVGRLDHPNIVPIHDVGVDDKGRYFFVMKHLRGETLEAIIHKLAAGDPAYHRRFTFEYRTTIFLQVLRAIQFAHAQNIIHRDIKPSNIMVGDYGEVVVMDWGIAKTVHGRAPAGTAPISGRISETAIGALVGTPAYMSPEQARGQNDQLDERSDVYSLCALFYELLLLRRYLRPHDNMASLLHAVITQRPVAAYRVRSRYQAAVPLDLWYFVQRGLAKAPEHRFQSVSEMISRLQANLEGKVCVQCPITALKRVTRGFLRFADAYPPVALLLSLMALSLMGYAAVHLLRGAALALLARLAPLLP